MPNRYHDNLEDCVNEVRDRVEEAVKECNFDSLSREVGRSIDEIFDEWKIGPGTRRWSEYTSRRTVYAGGRSTGEFVPGPGAQALKGAGNYPGNKSAAGGGKASSARPALYNKNLPGAFAGPLCRGIGLCMVGLNGLITVGGILTGEPSYVGMCVLFGGLTAAGAGLMYYGRSLKNRIRRFRTYQNVLSDRTFCEIAELAGAVGKEESFVVKDVRGMISDRFFLQGHMDRMNTTLMVDNNTYQQYLSADQGYQQRLEAEKARRQTESDLFGSLGDKDPEFRQAVEEGQQYIREIREANDAIPGEEISNKLYRLEDVLKKIFLVLNQKPDQLGKLRKFMNYYMPTTRKLVQTYRELDAQPVAGENISRAKAEIEETLDTINAAYEKLLDSFYEDALMDIHTDRAVLDSMLREDGLKDNPFEQKMVQQGL